MSRSANASRIVGLLVLLMAAVVVLSGPVAEVLDPGSEPVAEAKKKHKKKKKKKKKNRPPAFNVVQCPNDIESNDSCAGTEGNDLLIGGPEDRVPNGAFDFIEGKGGNDVYNGGNGDDTLRDLSTTSSDSYLYPATEFGTTFGGLNASNVIDTGGGGDVVNLQSYSIAEFDVSTSFSPDDLLLNGPGDREVVVQDFFDGENFGAGKIETFLFKDGAFTADDLASRIE